MPKTIEKNKNDYKVIPVFKETRQQIKNRMRKVDTYDSYIVQMLNRVDELEKKLAIAEAELNKKRK